MATFAGMLMEFDGTTRSDAIDALTQWILFDKYKLVDPQAALPAHAPRAVKQKSPMATAMAGVMAGLMAAPDDSSNFNSDICNVFSKWKPAKGSERK